MDDRDTVVAGGGGGGGAVDAGERVVVLAKMALGLVTAAKERNKNSFVTLVRELKPVLFAWKGAVRDQVLRDPEYRRYCEGVERALTQLLASCKQAMSPASVEIHRQEASRQAKLLAQAIKLWSDAHSASLASAVSAKTLSGRQMETLTSSSPTAPITLPQPTVTVSSSPRRAVPAMPPAKQVAESPPTSLNRGQIMCSTLLKQDSMDLYAPGAVDQMNSMADVVFDFLNDGKLSKAVNQLYALLENAKVFCLTSVQASKKQSYFEMLQELYVVSSQVAAATVEEERATHVGDMIELVGSLIEETNDLSLFKTSQDNLLAETVESTTQSLSNDNANIWDEVERDPERIKYSGSAVRCASINQLIYKVTDADSSDAHFVQTFLATFHTFMTAQSLLEKLKQRHQVPAKEREKQHVIQARVYNVLTRWIQRHFEDWDQDLIVSCREWLDAAGVRFADKLNATLDKSILEENLGFLHEAEQEFKLQQQQFDESQSMVEEDFLRLRPAEIAQQVSLVFFDVFRSIPMREIAGGLWANEWTRRRAPYVTKMSDLFNALSHFVQYSIVMIESLRERQKLLRKWIRILRELFSLKNFDGCMAVLTALASGPVRRLRFTWDGLPSKEEQELEDFRGVFDSAKNYERIRVVMQSVSNDGGPCVPYLGVFLTDVAFILEGSPDFLDRSLINWKKRESLAAALDSIAHYQEAAYQYPRIETHFTFIKTLQLHEPATLMQWSLDREPRECTRKEDLEP